MGHLKSEAHNNRLQSLLESPKDNNMKPDERSESWFELSAPKVATRFASQQREIIQQHQHHRHSTGNQLEHQLIRMHQESYLRSNRCSIASSSNLSNSIELMNEDSSLGSSFRLQSSTVTESRKLRAIRQRLDRCKLRATRSSSSFSDKIGLKFEHFRHSWKNLLYRYNQFRHSQQQVDDDAVEQHRSGCSPVNKRRLTQEWIWKHHNSRPDR